MTTVWVKAHNRIVALGVAELLSKLGYCARLEPEPTADLALWCQTPGLFHLPTPPALPTLALLNLSCHEDEVELLRLGYRGLLRPDDGIEQLECAVRTVQGGQVWADELLWAQARTPCLPDLSPEEYQLMRLVRSGVTEHEIAKRLQIAPSAVRPKVLSILLGHATPVKDTDA